MQMMMMLFQFLAFWFVLAVLRDDWIFSFFKFFFHFFSVKPRDARDMLSPREARFAKKTRNLHVQCTK